MLRNSHLGMSLPARAWLQRRTSTPIVLRMTTVLSEINFSPDVLLELPDGQNIAMSDGGGVGAPVLFLHGAVTDHRIWRPHQQLIGQKFRPLAYTQRFHGIVNPVQNPPRYGVRTHSRDLIAVVEALRLGPVHLVAWSYACHVAFYAALLRPDLFRGLFAYEPGFSSYINDADALARFEQDARSTFAPIFAAVGRGDTQRALELLIESSTGEAGSFARQQPQLRTLELENAHTLESLLRQEPPPLISAEELSRLQLPVAVGYGARTRPIYAISSAAAQECLSRGLHFVVPGAGHLWPQEEPSEFADRLIDFLQEASAAKVG